MLPLCCSRPERYGSLVATACRPTSVSPRKGVWEGPSVALSKLDLGWLPCPAVGCCPVCERLGHRLGLPPTTDIVAGKCGQEKDGLLRDRAAIPDVRKSGLLRSKRRPAAIRLERNSATFCANTGHSVHEEDLPYPARPRRPDVRRRSSELRLGRGSPSSAPPPSHALSRKRREKGMDSSAPQAFSRSGNWVPFPARLAAARNPGSSKEQLRRPWISTGRRIARELFGAGRRF